MRAVPSVRVGAFWWSSCVATLGVLASGFQESGLEGSRARELEPAVEAVEKWLMVCGVLLAEAACRDRALQSQPRPDCARPVGRRLRHATTGSLSLEASLPVAHAGHLLAVAACCDPTPP